MEDGRMEALLAKCVYWEEDKEGIELEKANAVSGTGAHVCPCAHPPCSSQLSRGPRTFPSHAALQNGVQ